MPVRFVLLLLAAGVIVVVAGSDATPASAYSCGAIATSWPTPAGDEDCDGYSSDHEDYMTTRQWVACPGMGSPPAWPPDLALDDNWVDISDVLVIKQYFGWTVPPGPTRHNLVWDNWIDISDVLALKPLFNVSCNIAPGAPAASYSRYMSTVETCFSWEPGYPCALRRMGRFQASLPPDSSIVVLDFGRPYYQGNVYGTKLFSGAFVSIELIEAAVKDYLRGYWEYSTPGDHVTLVIGTTNCIHSVDPSECPPQSPDPIDMAQHGHQWADMVDSVNSWIVEPPSYAAREIAWGGIDIEPNWSSYEEARQWAEDGYSAWTDMTYVNFGAADGCPPFGSCDNGWTQQNVRHLSYGIFEAWPLPEVYHKDGNTAVQWQRVSKDAGWMDFKGTMTQIGACGYSPCDPIVTNTPGQGWQQLWVLLNGDPATTDWMEWTTDITWAN